MVYVRCAVFPGAMMVCAVQNFGEIASRLQPVLPLGVEQVHQLAGQSLELGESLVVGPASRCRQQLGFERGNEFECVAHGVSSHWRRTPATGRQEKAPRRGAARKPISGRRDGEIRAPT